MFLCLEYEYIIYNLDFCIVQITSRWLSVYKIFCDRVIFIMKTDSSLISLAKSHLSYFNMKYSLRRYETRTCLSSKMYIIFFPSLPLSSSISFHNQSVRYLFMYSLRDITFRWVATRESRFLFDFLPQNKLKYSSYRQELRTFPFCSWYTPGFSQYECYYETSHEYFPGPTIVTITLSLDFFFSYLQYRYGLIYT